MRRDKGKTFILLTIITVLCLTGCQKNEEQPTSIVQEESVREKYDRAQSLLAQDRFSDAAAVFGELGSYEESAKLTMYCTAAAAGEAGDYETAFFTFKKLADYKESSFMETYYHGRENETRAEAENGERWDYLTEAAQIYESLAGFRDSAKRAMSCRERAVEAAGALEMSDKSLKAFAAAYMEKGEAQKALVYFEKIRERNEARNRFDPDNLMMLGNAYEATGRTNEAAELYEEIYTKVPTCSEAYQAHIRILLDSGREEDLKCAPDLMKKAYNHTQNETFRTQLQDFLPSPPEANLTPGYYESMISISLTTFPGENEIYYTFDPEAQLPYGGTLYVEPIILYEGNYQLRAVCVNGELVSEELKGTYRIRMPSPQMPRCNLAPSTYKTRQYIRLMPGKENINDDDIVIYYTIDGSTPDADSPIYRNAEAVFLPTGRVTLQAVAVNKYGRTSNPLIVNYKIDAQPSPKTLFTDDDLPSEIRSGGMTWTEFSGIHGEGIPTITEGYDENGSEIRRYDYSWGYTAVSLSNRKTDTWVVTEISYNTDGVFTAPRGTGIGNDEDFVTSRFRDMGQEESPSHNRGLYYNEQGRGKIWQQDDGTRIIRYSYIADSRAYQLEYHLLNNQVYRIDMKCNTTSSSREEQDPSLFSSPMPTVYLTPDPDLMIWEED